MAADLGRLSDLPEEDWDDAVEAVYACFNGRNPSAVVAAMFFVGLRMSLMNGGTKEQVASVLKSMLDSMEGSRSN